MKNIILIVSLLLMGVSSRADILNSSDNKNVADKFDPMLKAALFQMKIIADTSSILLSDIDYVEDLELKTSLWINNDVNRAKTTRHEITSLKGLFILNSTTYVSPSSAAHPARWYIVLTRIPPG